MLVVAGTWALTMGQCQTLCCLLVCLPVVVPFWVSQDSEFARLGISLLSGYRWEPGLTSRLSSIFTLMVTNPVSSHLPLTNDNAAPAHSGRHIYDGGHKLISHYCISHPQNMATRIKAVNSNPDNKLISWDLGATRGRRYRDAWECVQGLNNVIVGSERESKCNKECKQLLLFVRSSDLWIDQILFIRKI